MTRIENCQPRVFCINETDKVIVGIFVIGLVGLLCDKAFLWIIRKWVRGGVENS